MHWVLSWHTVTVRNAWTDIQNIPHAHLSFAWQLQIIDCQVYCEHEVQSCKVCSFEYCHTVITTEHTCFHTIAIDLCSLKGIATSLQWNTFFIFFLSYCNLFCICVFVTQLRTISVAVMGNSYPFLAVQYKIRNFFLKMTSVNRGWLTIINAESPDTDALRK